METFKTTVRCSVLAFVFIAGAVTFAGLDPDSKAQAESMAEENNNSEEISLGSPKGEPASVVLGNAG